MDKQKLLLILAFISAVSLVTITLNSSHERHMFRQCIKSSLKSVDFLSDSENGINRAYSYAYSRCMGGKALDY